jgi:hypothetical protein
MYLFSNPGQKKKKSNGRVTVLDLDKFNEAVVRRMVYNFYITGKRILQLNL